ncbi:hypothetical protein MRX96_018578 [Rhipicephalus microplus]
MYVVSTMDVVLVLKHRSLSFLRVARRGHVPPRRRTSIGALSWDASLSPSVAGACRGGNPAELGKDSRSRSRTCVSVGASTRRSRTQAGSLASSPGRLWAPEVNCTLAGHRRNVRTARNL